MLGMPLTLDLIVTLGLLRIQRNHDGIWQPSQPKIAPINFLFSCSLLDILDCTSRHHLLPEMILVLSNRSIPSMD